MPSLILSCDSGVWRNSCDDQNCGRILTSVQVSENKYVLSNFLVSREIICFKSIMKLFQNNPFLDDEADEDSDDDGNEHVDRQRPVCAEINDMGDDDDNDLFQDTDQLHLKLDLSDDEEDDKDGEKDENEEEEESEYCGYVQGCRYYVGCRWNMKTDFK